MDKEACPCCTHSFVRKLHSNAVLNADEEQVEKLKAQRMVAWENLPPSTRSAKAPRAGKKRVQEYFCICFQQRNSCKCAVGPFNDADREKIPDWHEEWCDGKDDDEPRPTISDNVGSFVDNLVKGSLQVCFPTILNI